MKNVTMILVVVVMALGLLAASSAQAGIIAQHVGSNDPATEGWNKFFWGTGVGTADAGPPPNWHMVVGGGTSTRASSILWIQSL